MGKRHAQHSMESKRAAMAEYMAGIKVAEICRRYEISSGMLYYWKRRSDKGLLDGNPDKETMLEKRVAELERMVGRLTMENELLKKARAFMQEQVRRKESLLPPAMPRDGQLVKDARQ
jgi:transposase